MSNKEDNILDRPSYYEKNHPAHVPGSNLNKKKHISKFEQFMVRFGLTAIGLSVIGGIFLSQQKENAQSKAPTVTIKKSTQLSTQAEQQKKSREKMLGRDCRN